MTDLEAYIEEVGLYYETVGLPRMAGRILGYIMSCPKELASFDELVEALKASKGSISGNINLLKQRRLIDKVMQAGDRKSYYKLSGAELFSMIDAKIGSFTRVKEIMGRANELNGDETLEKHRQIAEFVRFYEFMEREMPKLREKWERERRRE